MLEELTLLLGTCRFMLRIQFLLLSMDPPSTPFPRLGVSGMMSGFTANMVFVGKHRHAGFAHKANEYPIASTEL